MPPPRSLVPRFLSMAVGLPIGFCPEPRAAEVQTDSGPRRSRLLSDGKLSDSGTSTNTDAANAAAEANPNPTGDAASNGAHRRRRYRPRSHRANAPKRRNRNCRYSF
jgi:hypothetical protein